MSLVANVPFARDYVAIFPILNGTKLQIGCSNDLFIMLTSCIMAYQVYTGICWSSAGPAGHCHFVIGNFASQARNKFCCHTIGFCLFNLHLKRINCGSLCYTSLLSFTGLAFAYGCLTQVNGIWSYVQSKGSAVDSFFFLCQFLEFSFMNVGVLIIRCALICASCSIDSICLFVSKFLIPYTNLFYVLY